MALMPARQFSLLKLLTRHFQQRQQLWMHRTITLSANHFNRAKTDRQDQDESRELLVTKSRDILQKEFPSHFRDGKFISRMSYVEFIDEALAKMKELGIEKDLNAYKELLKVFPPGKYWPNKWEFGLFHAPQQLAAIRVLHQMQRSGLKPDKEFEKIVIDAFSRRSDVWVKIARMNYWSMKGRHIDPYPLPEKLPEEAHRMAKTAVARMLDDPKSILTVANTSRVPGSVDKTWVVFSQCPRQKEIIDKLDERSTLYIEAGGLAYVGKDSLSYYLLKYYVDEKTRAEKSQTPGPDFNFNTLKVKFFGKPIKEKYLAMTDKHYVDGSYILGIAITGTSSQDSLLSWLKLMQERNPNLKMLNVIFKMSRPSPEIVKYTDDDEGNQERQQSQSDNGR